MVSLYTPDANSAKAAERMERTRLPIVTTPFGELELINALQLRLFRKELPARQLRAAYAAFRADVHASIIEIKPLSDAVFLQARRLASKWTRKLGTRTLDIVHVASALSLGLDAFNTFDERQRRLANAAGLATP